MPTDDFVYENAPLREVIVQAWWRLQPLFGSQEAAIDPHFAVFSEEFQKRAQAAGFPHVEQVLPQQVPLELLAHKAVLRFRREPHQWPVLQIGPGVLTTNIVPPYQGWKGFAAVVENALEMLWESYPLPDRYLTITKVHLNYINGFTNRHGLSSISSFLRDQLQLAPHLGAGLLEITDRTDEVRYSGTIELITREPVGALLVLNYSPGKVFDDPALILQNQVTTTRAEIPQNPEEILQWLSRARNNTRRAFEAILSPEIEKRIGPRKPIGT